MRQDQETLTAFIPAEENGWINAELFKEHYLRDYVAALASKNDEDLESFRHVLYNEDTHKFLGLWSLALALEDFPEEVLFIYQNSKLTLTNKTDFFFSLSKATQEQLIQKVFNTSQESMNDLELKRLCEDVRENYTTLPLLKKLLDQNPQNPFAQEIRYLINPYLKVLSDLEIIEGCALQDVIKEFRYASKLPQGESNGQDLKNFALRFIIKRSKPWRIHRAISQSGKEYNSQVVRIALSIVTDSKSEAQYIINSAKTLARLGKEWKEKVAQALISMVQQFRLSFGMEKGGRVLSIFFLQRILASSEKGIRLESR